MNGWSAGNEEENMTEESCSFTLFLTIPAPLEEMTPAEVVGNLKVHWSEIVMQNAAILQGTS